MKNVKIWDTHTFLDRVDFFASSKGITLRQLCHEAELDESFFRHIKARNTLPSLSSICAICDVLGISLFVFFNIEEVIYSQDALFLISYNDISEESRQVLNLLIQQLK